MSVTWSRDDESFLRSARISRDDLPPSASAILSAAAEMRAEKMQRDIDWLHWQIDVMRCEHEYRLEHDRRWTLVVCVLGAVGWLLAIAGAIW